MHNQYIERVVDLTEPALNVIHNMTVDQAREAVWSGDPNKVRAIDGSFALVAREGKTVRLARSLDRPMRYFLAKRAEGPALIVADRLDAIKEQLERENLPGQFHPSYTRMVPAHYILELQLIGCPDPDPTYTRYFDPKHNTQGTDLDAIGAAYIGALAEEIRKWLLALNPHAPIGVCFSGGIDSGSVFLTTLHVMRKLGMNPARLKAFTLTFGDGADLEQSRAFLEQLGLGLFHEPVEGKLGDINIEETLRIVEDYKLLDVEAASMVIALLKGIRRLYPDWIHLQDGDGGDENLKDYPIEENRELTIRSVVHNQMLYHEGWGVGRIKHSLTYSGGLSRSYTRTYAPARRFGFSGFSPFSKPAVVEVAEGVPFIELTQYDAGKLYSLKGEVVSRGVKQIAGMNMPVFEKRRFQHGAMGLQTLRQNISLNEHQLRRKFYAMHED
jgi:asparagine synthase (glutamine-hydrolysing)